MVTNTKRDPKLSTLKMYANLKERKLFHELQLVKYFLQLPATGNHKIAFSKGLFMYCHNREDFDNLLKESIEHFKNAVSPQLR